MRRLCREGDDRWRSRRSDPSSASRVDDDDPAELAGVGIVDERFAATKWNAPVDERARVRRRKGQMTGRARRQAQHVRTLAWPAADAPKTIVSDSALRSVRSTRVPSGMRSNGPGLLGAFPSSPNICVTTGGALSGPGNHRATSATSDTDSTPARSVPALGVVVRGRGGERRVGTLAGRVGAATVTSNAERSAEEVLSASRHDTYSAVEVNDIASRPIARPSGLGPLGDTMATLTTLPPTLPPLTTKPWSVAPAVAQ